MSKEVNFSYQNDHNKLSFGDLGLRVLTGSSTAGESFGCLYAMEDSTVSFTSNADGGDATVSSLAMLAGQVVYGDITSITVASGKVIGYLRKY